MEVFTITEKPAAPYLKTQNFTISKSSRHHEMGKS